MQQSNRTLGRIGIIGDIHAESLLLARALEFLQTQKPDAIMTVGDIVDGRHNVDHCCALLKKYSAAAVRGNHERWFLENDMRNLPYATMKEDVNADSYRYLATLAITRQFDTLAGRLLLCHGLLENDMAAVQPDDAGYALEFNFDLQRLLELEQFAVVVNGHSHLRMVRNIEGLTLINAGTLKHDNDPGFGLVDFETRRVQFFRMDETAVFEMETLDF